MTAIRHESFFLLLILGLFCVANSNPITSLFGKSSDDKAETTEKAATPTTAAAKTGEITTTTTLAPGSSCGGLKGFLHICDKTEATEPPKNIKTRSVSDDDDSSDSSSDSDSDESNETPKPTENSTTVSEATEGKISKRQVGDPEAPVLGEIPLVVEDAMEVSEESSEEEKEETEKEEEEEKKKREVDDSDSSSDSDEDETKETRQRRDCQDKDGDDKDCRKKRELVPTTTANQTTPTTEA